MNPAVESHEHRPRLLVALLAAVLAIVVALGAAVDAHASTSAGPVAGTRVAAHDHPGRALVGAADDVLAGEGRRTTTPDAGDATGSRVAPNTASLADDAVTTGRTASTSWGRTIDDFQQYGDQWRRVSAHAEGATGRAYRGGTSLEEVFERGGDRLIRHRIYDPNGEILHETFRPYAKFGAP